MFKIYENTTTTNSIKTSQNTVPIISILITLYKIEPNLKYLFLPDNCLFFKQ